MTEPPSSRAVWTALGLAAGPASAFAFARFAYAVLLPPMQADLDWSYATAALLNTTNAAGYLLGISPVLTAHPSEVRRKSVLDFVGREQILHEQARLTIGVDVQNSFEPGHLRCPRIERCFRF